MVIWMQCLFMNFREEAIALAKQILEDWDYNRDFNEIVTILEDYITDMDTKYKGLMENG